MNEIITKEEQSTLLKWIYDNEEKFIPNKFKYRKYFPINESECPTLFFEIKQRILDNEKIKKWEKDPFFGDIITFVTNNGFIHNHIDSTLPNKNHFRFNLFLSKPFLGGDPIYNNKKLNFKERCYLKYCVNKDYHSSLQVIGSKPRIAISYGISVD